MGSGICKFSCWPSLGFQYKSYCIRVVELYLLCIIKVRPLKYCGFLIVIYSFDTLNRSKSEGPSPTPITSEHRCLPSHFSVRDRVVDTIVVPLEWVRLIVSFNIHTAIFFITWVVFDRVVIYLNTISRCNLNRLLHFVWKFYYMTDFRSKHKLRFAIL